jgi:flagellar motor switch protein FliG
VANAWRVAGAPPGAAPRPKSLTLLRSVDSIAVMPGPADEYRKEQRAGKPRRDPSAGKPRRDPSIRGFIKETSRDAGYRKAAQFLMLIGKDEAVRVLRHMSAEEVEGITREIARTQHIEEKEASKILEEFGFIRETKDLIAQGGIEKAQEMLTASLGAEKAEKILARVRKDLAPPPFTFMQDIDAHQAISLVKEESVPVAALILAHLEPKLAARILSALSPEVQRAVVPRIAKMQKVDADVIRRAEEMLRSKVREKGEPVTEEVNGRATLTEILRFMDPGKEQAILADLEPNMANLIRKDLFTIDVVFQLPDKDLQKVMRNYSDRELAVVIKGAEEPVRLRLLSAVSERRRELIRLEEDVVGPIRKTDYDRAVQDFLEYIQLLEQKGEIVILREREEFV